MKVTKEPKKRISTQQKIGSGHAKGPMANNVQSSVPLPVVMPFPMIPFDDRYPIIFTPNGKPNKGKGKKKDPKGETEDETDKDIDDENDTGEKEYKGAGNVKHGPYSKQRPEMIQSAPVLEEAEREASEADDDKNQATNENETERDGSGDNENEADENSEEDNQQTTQKQIALFPISIQKANENESEPEENDDEADEKEADENESEAQEKQRDSKDNEKRDSKDKQKSLAESLLNSVSKPKKSKSKSKKPRERRETYEPIVGNPEDIMPYLFFGTEEEPVVEGDKAHIITTRSAEEEEYNGIDERTDDYDAPHGMWRRDVDEEEEDEDEARDMRPRSVPDGRSYETVTYHKGVDVVRNVQKFVQ